MAFVGITATEAEIKQKSGANVNAAFTVSNMTQSLLHAESYLNTLTEHNWSDNYGTLDVDTKYIVTEATASYVAMEVINYDPDAIGRSTATLRLNVLAFKFNQAVKELKEQGKRAFVQKA